jgi:hypothetical protein
LNDKSLKEPQIQGKTMNLGFSDGTAVTAEKMATKNVPIFQKLR